jgi:hypothetical protein
MKDHLMPILNEKIILDSERDAYLLLKHSLVFPDQKEGIKLWEGGIIMSRYIIKHGGLVISP